ncbi:helix-turn-helix domain-containing protein [Microbacterium gallinarum]|nr:helix-turn-helix domain-containing protein [Microbacterium gallinarum]
MLTSVAQRLDRKMNRSDTSLALTFKDAATLVGVDYRTIKAGVDRGTIPSVQLGPRRMIPRAALLRIFGVEA